jgi:ADP-ribose diphosphatase
MEHRQVATEGRRSDRSRYFALVADSDGVEFVRCGDGVLVVPVIDDGEVLLAVERSPAFGRNILTLVAGSVEEGEPLAESANRELQEEMGYRAERMDYLGELYPFKYVASRQFAFLARGLTPGALQGDEAHPIGARRVPLAAIAQLCASGELHDSLAIAALFLAQQFLSSLP